MNALNFKITAILICFMTVAFWLLPAAVAARERFVENGDGTVTDLESGLMWSQTDNNADIFRKEAQDWIENKNAPPSKQQYNDWRLPTVDELKTLYVDNPGYKGYRAACGHEVKMIPQIQISCILVWSSSSALGLPVAFNFYLGDAFTVDIHDNAGCRVLAVRNAE